MFRWWDKPALALLCAAAFAQQSSVIRVDVKLMRVIATVKNTAGELVGSLQKSDFEIRDRGVPQEVAVFERTTEQPLSVALLIDNSGSTAKDLKYEADSANKFLKALFNSGNPEDVVQLYTFNDEVRLERRWTRNYQSLERILRSMKGDSGSSVYDAVHYAARELEQREGRKVIIIVTDGGDTTSAIPLKQALEEVQLADAVIYPVVVVPITNPAGRNTGGEHALIFMAEGTGGRTFFPTVGEQLDKAFADIITELRSQYLLGFYPRDVPLTKDPFHPISVKVKTPGLRVSARNGYYGDFEGDARGHA
jgi:Ca-activated chloride channel family protein